MTAEQCAEIENEFEVLKKEGHKVKIVHIYREVRGAGHKLEGVELHHYPLTCTKCGGGHHDPH